MQLVDFNVQILIHDDASTDNTASIVKEYEKRYPNLIKGIYEIENQHSKRTGMIGKILRKEIKGKYRAVCEGDDYWTDPYKLYLQVTAMELNPDSHFCVHRVKLLDHSDIKKNSLLPKKKYKNKLFSDTEFIKIINKAYSFQTSSYFYKSIDYFKYIDNKPFFAKQMPTGDEATLRYFGSLGQTIYFERTMSCYEQYLEGSWSSKQNKQNEQDLKKHLKKQYMAIMEFNKWSNYKYGRNDKIILKMMLLDKKYKDIFENKKYKCILWSMSKKTYFVVCLKTYHPGFYKFLKRIFR